MKGTLSRSFAKERNGLAFFSILCKRPKRSLRSFLFFAKEQNVLLGLISRQILEKRTGKNGKEQNVLFLERKKRNVPNGKERSAQPCS